MSFNVIVCLFEFTFATKHQKRTLAVFSNRLRYATMLRRRKQRIRKRRKKRKRKKGDKEKKRRGGRGRKRRK